MEVLTNWQSDEVGSDRKLLELLSMQPGFVGAFDNLGIGCAERLLAEIACRDTRNTGDGVSFNVILSEFLNGFWHITSFLRYLPREI